MKTNQEMVRQMGNLEVIQRTVDGYFNATRLVKLWNERNSSNKELKKYFENESTKELIATIVEKENLTYIIHSGFISGYQNRYGDNLKPPTNVYHRMTA